MHKAIAFIFLICAFGIAIWAYLFDSKLPELKTSLINIVEKAKEAEFDTEKWKTVYAESQEIPAIYPFTKIKNIFTETYNIVLEIETLKTNSNLLVSDKIKINKLYEIFDSIEKIKKSVDSIGSALNSFPDSVLTESQLTEKNKILTKIWIAQEILNDIEKAEKIVRKLINDEERVLILLQNENEPRSTGGFCGTVLIIDFTADEILWDFSDIYSLSRKIPNEAHLKAPDFLLPIAPTLSIQDANIYPHFEKTADTYRYFFESMNEKIPSTIMAINMNLIEEILRLTGPIYLEKWDIYTNQYNFDSVLQFLVGSKIEGRFGVRKPVMYFAQKLLDPHSFRNIKLEQVIQFDLAKFIAGKNILAHSQNSKLQRLFRKWKIDGQLKQKESDNFLHFDFVSVGANKSEKFVWTKFNHDSEIAKNGLVTNTIKITRTNTLKKGEIFDLLETEKWSKNVLDLLDSKMLWILGEGENRTILRIYVPKYSELISFDNLSGPVTESLSYDEEFKIFEIPLYVLAGESLKSTIKYTTQIKRGSLSWRPYYLKLSGTPGRTQTKFLSTISLKEKGSFRAETENIGLPIPLIDNDLRTVIKFD